MSFSVSSEYSKTTYHYQHRCHDRTGLASKRPDPMTGVERDVGGHVYEPSADCERGGTNARALVLGPILVVPRAWLRQGQ